MLNDDVTEIAAPNGFFTVRHGDARQMDFLFAQAAPSPLVTSTITSPPYADLKNYGHSEQIGWGQSYEEYLVEMRRIFRSIHRHTRDDGSMWLIADTLREQGGHVWRMEPLPFRLSGEAEQVGWILRDIIIWQKNKTLPWSGRGRLRNAFEYILFFIKSDNFKYYVDRVRDPVRLEQWWVKWPERYNPQGKVPTNVWSIPIPVQGAWKNTDLEHMCPLPPDLVERLIVLSTDPGDVVFDPFAGTGVVVAEAERLGRRGLGIELVNRHVRAYRARTIPEIMKRNSADILSKRLERTRYLQDVIPKLRVVKLPRVLLRQLMSKRCDLPKPRLAIALMEGAADAGVPAETNKLIRARLIFAVKQDTFHREEMRRCMKKYVEIEPASKFGIAAEIDVVGLNDVAALVRRKKIFLYQHGRTWMTEGRITPSKVAALLKTPTDDTWPPILSNVYVHEKPRALTEDSDLPSELEAESD